MLELKEQDYPNLPAHMRLALNAWVAEYEALKQFKADAQATIADLQRQVEACRQELERTQGWFKKCLEAEQRVAQLSEKVAHYDRWLSGGVYFTKAEYEVHVKDRNNLREEHIKLQADHATLLGLVQAATKLLTELTIIPIGCSREQELAWKKAVKDLRTASLPAQPAQGGA